MNIRATLRSGFTIIEMLAVIAIIGVLVGLLLPSVQAARERARQVSCSNNMMQVGLGVTAYHATFEQFPVHLSGTDGSTVVGADNDRRLSFLVALLPFLGHDPLQQQLLGQLPVEEFFDDGYYMSMDETVAAEAAGEDKKLWVAGGPEPFQKNYPVWRFEVPEFRCPSDPGVGSPALGRTNYAACLGDGVVAMDTGPLKDVNGVFQWDQERAAQTEASMRGVFVPRSVTRFRDVSDGLSSTLLLGEIATHLGDADVRTDAVIGPSEKALSNRPNWAYESDVIDSERPHFWLTNTQLMSAVAPGAARGYRWADGAPLFTAFNTILPPNQAIALSQQKEDRSGIFPPSSRHQGAVGVCMADGSVRFVTDSIDAGDRNSPTVYVGSSNQPNGKSVYGVWGAMGTRASEELVWFDSDR